MIVRDLNDCEDEIDLLIIGDGLEDWFNALKGVKIPSVNSLTGAEVNAASYGYTTLRLCSETTSEVTKVLINILNTFNSTSRTTFTFGIQDSVYEEHSTIIDALFKEEGFIVISIS